MHTTTRPAHYLSKHCVARFARACSSLVAQFAVLAFFVAACSGPVNTSGDERHPESDLSSAALALAAGDYPAVVVITAPLAAESDEAAILLARGRLGLADDLARAGDDRALRTALDQIALALAVTPRGHRFHVELEAREKELLGRVSTPIVAEPRAEAGGDEGPATTATPAPVVPSPVPNATASPAPQPPTRPGRTAAPLTPIFAVAQRKSFEGSGTTGQFAACIDVQVIGRTGPVGGAVIGINNGDLSYQDQADQHGYVGRCGLGASTWSVVLFWTPVGGQVHGAATTVYLNGAPEQRASIVFQQR